MLSGSGSGRYRGGLLYLVRRNEMPDYFMIFEIISRLWNTWYYYTFGTAL